MMIRLVFSSHGVEIYDAGVVLWGVHVAYKIPLLRVIRNSTINRYNI